MKHMVYPGELQAGDVVVDVSDTDPIMIMVERAAVAPACCDDFDKVITDTGLVRETHRLGCPALSDALIIRRAPE